ncbi:hypothetical protein ACROYT_G020065 [Oculina patagonica]
MNKNTLNFVLLVLLTLFQRVEASFVGVIIGYIILALVILGACACVIACLFGGCCACISEMTRSHTGTTTTNTLATVQAVHVVCPQQSGAANPDDLLTVCLQSTSHPQAPFQAVCMPSTRERPSPTAPPLAAEPPPQYPVIDLPPPYSAEEPPPPYSIK